MKLRNKKTGEIVDFAKSDCLYSKCEKICFANNDGTYLWYYSLADLFEEWEDYEEPKEKEYWYYDTSDHVFTTMKEECERDDYRIKDKEIGNCFSTKEEVEKAVEKLKAWKRLKDKGFRFKGVTPMEYFIRFSYDKPRQILDIQQRPEVAQQFNKDLGLLFGGEE